MIESIKLLELFSGIQSQERALRQLNIPYESVGVCDCDKDVLVASAAMRFDLEKEIENYDFPDTETMIKELQDKNIGYSFEKQKHTITNRTPISKLKQYYISDKLLNNLGDISKVKRLPRANFVTYSSPCQSFSVAGKLAGAAKTCTKCGHKWDIDFSNPDYNYKCPVCGNASLESTTSGLLQEVQRLLSVAYEENELPEYLMLENVKNLVQKKFIEQFNAWVKWLDSIGYNTYYQVLNAKNYGIPQNRERIFAISIRKDIDTNGFTFPEPIPLTTRLKDILEHNVDEKYYLPDERIEKILNSSFMQEKKRIQTTDVCDTLLARDWKDPKCVPVEENEIKVVGNYMPSNHDASRVVDVDGIAPTVKENHGTVTAIAEPFVVASRGRNPENPSDRMTGAPTEQRLEPNFSGTTNCLTSVAKDNYVCEPKIVQNPHGFNKGSVQEECPSITSSYFQENNYVAEPIAYDEQNDYIREDGTVGTITTDGSSPKHNNRILEPIVYDDYNSHISSDQDAINTLTCNCGASAERNGVKIIEPVIVEDFYQNREPRMYSDVAPTLRSERTGLKVVDEVEYPCSTRGKQVASAIRASIYKQGARNLEENVTNGLGYEGVIEQKSEINPKLVGGIGEKNFGKQYRQGNRVYDSDEIAMALNAQPVGNTGGYSYQYIVKEEQPKIKWRIRKLTPLECWRLMNFTDEDCNRAAQYVSASAQYKQAGNSIVVACLIAIFSSLFIEDGHKAEIWTNYQLNYWD